jgi:hypothetical protein
MFRDRRWEGEGVFREPPFRQWCRLHTQREGWIYVR